MVSPPLHHCATLVGGFSEQPTSACALFVSASLLSRPTFASPARPWIDVGCVPVSEKGARNAHHYGAPRSMKMGTIPSPWRYDDDLGRASIAKSATAIDLTLRFVALRLQAAGFPSKPIHITSLVAGHSLLVPAAVGNERRKPRGRRHDQLPRESGKAEHQARPGARCAVEAADRADDDAGAQGRRLDGDVGRTVAQICDEVHALIG